MSKLFELLQETTKRENGLTIRFHLAGSVGIYRETSFGRRGELVCGGKDEAELLANLAKYLVEKSGKAELNGYSAGQAA